MTKPSDSDLDWAAQAERIVGLGERSFKKSYYPQLQQNLAQLERFRTLLDHTPDVLILIDLPEGRVIDANAALGRLLAKQSVPLVGSRLEALALANGADILSQLREDLDQTSAPSQPHRTLIPFANPAGPGWLEVTYAIATQNGQPYGILVGRDVTERQRAEAEIARYRDHLENLVRERTAQLTEAREAAETANRAKSLFLANMSHELRTPLNAILGFSEMIGHDLAAPKAIREKASIINRSGEHLLSMINDVLDLSKIEAGKSMVQAEDIDLPALIEDIGRMFEERADAAGLRFSRELAPDITRYISVDSKKLRQVLINLLGNAVKFTEEGGVALRVRTTPITGDPRKLCLHLEVKDSGPGIPAHQQDDLFKPFVQLTTTANCQKGTGLGLSISKSLVELLGGRIGVESVAGQGALFWVELPVAVAEAAPALSGAAAVTVASLAPDQPAWRILVAEDDPENRLLLVSLLQAVGFEVREAENGEQAVVLFEQWQPHFIWMDMRMPVLDGYQATRRIRELSGGDAVKIVALTASVFRDQRQQIFDVGCNDIVHKPYRNHQIFDTMAHHLDLRYVYQTEEEAAFSMPEAMMIVAIGQLEQVLRQELIEAAVRGDQERFEAGLKPLDATNSGLALALRHLSDDFRYDKVLELLNHKKPS